MVKTKSMGIGSMFVVLVVAVVLLPMLVRYIDRSEPFFSISGFQDAAAMYSPDMYSSTSVSNIPAVGSASKLPSWRPDGNTDYLCRAPNGGDRPCEEGQFCDGPTQGCINNYVGGSLDNVEGYYS